MNQNFHIYGLTTEYAVNPIDLFTPKPRFSWKFGAYPGFRQKAYRIAVASSREKAERGAYDLWDSGFVAGSRNVAVEYGGRELGSRQEGFWKCFAEDERGECAESEIASFEIALLSPEDWKGSWQSAPHHFPGCAQYWRCPFVLPEKKIRRARAYVCGLGYHELYLNGAKIGQSVLNPGVTDYSKRVLYCTYDITESLQAGENCIGFILGYGWFGARKLIAQVYIDFADGTETELHTFHHAGLWRVGRGPVLENSVYGGEVYDARLERETEGWCTYPFHADYDNGWVFSICTDAPAGKLVSQTFEPIEPVADCKGNLVLQEEGRRIYDFSANIAGWVKIVVRGERGAKVTVRHAEILNPGGTELETVNLRTAKATDVYILKGEETEEYEPHFTYHGFRYAELSVEGKAEVLSVTGRFVRTAVKAVSSFSCSDDVINRLHRNAVATEGANIHSILTDCPQRDERFGWLNDITSRVFQEVYNFDMARLYPKIMRDIADTQRPGRRDIGYGSHRHRTDACGSHQRFAVIAGALFTRLLRRSAHPERKLPCNEGVGGFLGNQSGELPSFLFLLRRLGMPLSAGRSEHAGKRQDARTLYVRRILLLAGPTALACSGESRIRRRSRAVRRTRPKDQRRVQRPLFRRENAQLRNGQPDLQFRRALGGAVRGEIPGKLSRKTQ